MKHYIKNPSNVNRIPRFIKFKLTKTALNNETISDTRFRDTKPTYSVGLDRDYKIKDRYGNTTLISSSMITVSKPRAIYWNSRLTVSERGIIMLHNGTATSI
jgi:hypothetical protein